MHKARTDLSTVALMSLASIAYQFYLYPYVAPYLKLLVDLWF